MRITLRSAPEFVSSSRVLTVADVEVGSLAEQVGQIPGALTFRALRSEHWIDDAMPGRVVSLEARGRVHEFWVSQRRDTLRSELAVFQCDPIHTVLRDAGVLDWLSSDGMSHVNLGGPDGGMSFRNFWWTFVRPFLRRRDVTWIELGTVESDTRLRHSWEGVTPQAVIVALAEQLRHEWRLRRDSANSVYRLDVGAELGADADVAGVGEGLNLLTLRRQMDREDMATVLRPIGVLESGAPADISQALWVVTAVSGNTITLAPHSMIGGDGPVAENGQWVGAYLEATDGSAHEITASGTPQELTLTSGGSSFAVNDEVRFVADSASADQLEVSSPAAIGTYGRVAVGSRLPFFSRSPLERAGLVEWEDAQSVIGIRTREKLSDNRLTTQADAEDHDALFAATEGALVLAHRISTPQYTLSYYVLSGDDPSSDGDTRRVFTLSANPSSGAANRASGHLVHPGMPSPWRRDDTSASPMPIVLRRDTQTRAYVTSASRPTGFVPTEVMGLPAGTHVEPGDLIYSLSGDNSYDYAYWVLAPATADEAGTLTVQRFRYLTNTSSLTPEGTRIYRPTISMAALSHIPAVLADHQQAELILPSVRLAPRTSASLYAHLHFSAMAAKPHSSGWSTLPRLSLYRGNSSAASIEATNWTATSPGETTDERLILGPLAIAESGEYHLRFRPGDASYYYCLYILSASLYVGVDVASGSNLVPEAAVGIQLANLELGRRKRWRARYTCSLLELADQLKLSPEMIRTQIGSRVHIDSPALGINGRFRIMGIKWSPDSLRSEVELESVAETLTGRRAVESALFVHETGQRVSSAPPRGTGYYRAVEVSASQLSSRTPIDVERIT